MPPSPSDLRELADRLEQEAQTEAEEREAERLQRALDAGQDALADRIADKMLEKMGDRLERAFDDRFIASDENEDGGEEQEETTATGEDEQEEQEETVDVEGRWAPRKVFGARIYSGPPEPDTVRYRDENGKVQSRPGRRPGQPYQVEWEQVPDEPADESADAETEAA